MSMLRRSDSLFITGCAGALAVLLLASSPILADDWAPLGQVINGVERTELEGRSVAMPADGQIIAIGAPFANGSGGGVRGFGAGRVRGSLAQWQ